MTGLQLVHDMSKALSIKESLALSILKDVLKYGGKDLRAAPYITMIMDSMKGKTQEEILKALEQTKWKYDHITGSLHPNYFIKILSSIGPTIKEQQTETLNWGKSI